MSSLRRTPMPFGEIPTSGFLAHGFPLTPCGNDRLDFRRTHSGRKASHALVGGRSPLGRIVVAGLAFAFAGSLWAASAGSETGSLLRSGIDGRGVGMGEAQTAAVEGPMSMWWNPAGLGRMYQREVVLGRNSSVEGVNQTGLYYGRPSRSGSVWGLGVAHLGVGGLDGFDASGAPTGDVKADELLITGGWGRLWEDMGWLPGLQTGANLKVMRKTLDNESAVGYMADLGVLYETQEGFFRGLRTGLAAQNLGTGLTFGSERSKFPALFKGGWAYPLFGENMSVALDVVMPTGDKAHLNLGGEYRLWDILAFRLGWKGQADLDTGLTYGVRLGNERLHLDYALVPMGDFGDSHRVSLGFRFGKAYRQAKVTTQVEEAYQRALAKYGQGYLVDSYIQASQILAVAPWHRPARLLSKRIEAEFKSMADESRRGQLQAQVDEHFARGEQFFQMDDLVNSRREFQAIVALQPDHIGAKTYLGRIDEKFRTAADDFYRRGMIAFSAGDFDLAKQSLEHVLQIAPNHEEARVALGKVTEALRKQEEFEEERRKREIIAPLWEAGESLFAQGRYDEALKKYDDILVVDLSHQGASDRKAMCANLAAKEAYNTALAAAKGGRWDEAEIMAAKALKYRDDYSEARSLLNKIREERGRSNEEKSKKVYLEALDAFLAGDLDKGLELAREALRVDSGNKEAERLRDRILEMKGEGR